MFSDITNFCNVNTTRCRPNGT